MWKNVMKKYLDSMCWNSLANVLRRKSVFENPPNWINCLTLSLVLLEHENHKSFIWIRGKCNEIDSIGGFNWLHVSFVYMICFLWSFISHICWKTSMQTNTCGRTETNLNLLLEWLKKPSLIGFCENTMGYSTESAYGWFTKSGNKTEILTD